MAGPITRRVLLSHAVSATFVLPAAASTRAARPPTSVLPLVTLDPGHGGKDPGAIGVSGTYEKHVAFAAAQELQRQLLATGRYRVALTRGRDVFIPLERRVAIAQGQGAALFVSMHADALADHSVRGASVYTLSSDASDGQTADLARRENASDRFAGPSFAGASPEVARILASLVNRETRAGLRAHRARLGGRAAPRGRLAAQPGPAREFRGAEGARHPERVGRNGIHVEPAGRGGVATAGAPGAGGAGDVPGDRRVPRRWPDAPRRLTMAAGDAGPLCRNGGCARWAG